MVLVRPIEDGKPGRPWFGFEKSGLVIFRRLEILVAPDVYETEADNPKSEVDSSVLKGSI